MVFALHPYLAIFSARFRVLLQYRAAALAGFGTQLFWGFIRVMIFAAFYRASREPQPLTYSQVVTYIWLGQATIAMLFNTIDLDVRNMIRTGTVACELLRPLDLYAAWYSRSLALRVAPTLLRAVPMFAVAGLFFGLAPPASAVAALGWVVATAGAALLASAIAMLANVSLLWTVSGEGVARLLPAVIYTFSGMLVPLPLLPDWAAAALAVLPFRGLVDTPFRIYLGDISPAGILPALAHQLAWTILLVLFGRWLLARGMRRMVVQGG